ncbi:hypothetical protein QT237_16945 [Geobacillus stearothermophilus]|nr:hypothetical protein QT237_16945 [Geobacillus stearothermophilus]
MLHTNWFVRTMKRTFNVAVNIDEVGYEAYEFYHEELDNYLVCLVQNKNQSSATKSAERKAKKKGLPAPNLFSIVEVVNA